LSNWQAFFIISFKNTFAYKSSVVIGVFGSMFTLFVQIALWNFIFKGNSNMIEYMTCYVIISTILGILYTNNISSLIGDKVTSGDFVIDLIKPISPLAVFWSTSFGEIIANVLNRGIPVLIVFFPVLLTIQFNFQKGLLFLIASLMGFIVGSLIYILVGYISFIVLEIWPYIRLVNDTIRLLSGAIIPIAFFPMGIASIARATPFYFMYTFPIRLLLEELPLNEVYLNFFIMAVWIIVIGFVLRIVSNIAIKHCVVQGG